MGEILPLSNIKEANLAYKLKPALKQVRLQIIWTFYFY
jgi:hypothetical protein